MDKQHYMTSGSNKAMLCILFKDGVTNLAKFPSSHVIGVLLTIDIASITDEGRSLLSGGQQDGGHGAFEQNEVRVFDDTVVLELAEARLLLGMW
jgi:hypothetical protein